MSASIAGKAVISALVTMPFRGAWFADVAASSDDPITGRVLLDDAGIQFRGTAISGGLYGGRAHVRLVGGAGGLSIGVDAKPYRATTVGAVLADLLREGGETLASDSSSALLKTSLPFWERQRGSVGSGICELIVTELEANWRVRRDGAIWFGTDAFPSQIVDHQIIDQDETLGVWTVATDRAELLPAVTFEGRRVQRVVHQIAETARTEVWFA